MENAITTCLECHKQMKGRSDKKFCSEYCRNYFNNKLHSGTNKQLSFINKTLKNNRQILQQLVEQKMKKVTKDKLMRMGFSFYYFTNIYNTPKGASYFFCYDYGYNVLENGCYQLVKQPEGG